MAAKKKGGGVGVGILGFLRTLIVATMGRFFGCFRMKDSRHHPVRASRNKNVLSSVFCPQEPEIDSHLEKGKNGNPLPDVRAKFLKARKVSGKCADISTQKEEWSKCNSWIPSSSIEKLNFEKQPDESSTPFKVSGEWVTGAGFLVGTPSSTEEDTCISPKWWDGNGIPNTTTKYREDQKVIWCGTPFDEEDTRNSWDGNGIPNTTTKYKEDQKVRCHATPFEERLEKALSEDNIYQRRRISRSLLLEMNEIEELDTASSSCFERGV